MEGRTGASSAVASGKQNRKFIEGSGRWDDTNDGDIAINIYQLAEHWVAGFEQNSAGIAQLDHPYRVSLLRRVERALKLYFNRKPPPIIDNVP